MDKETIKSYLEEIRSLIEKGRIILAHQQLKFVIENILNR